MYKVLGSRSLEDPETRKPPSRKAAVRTVLVARGLVLVPREAPIVVLAAALADAEVAGRCRVIATLTAVVRPPGNLGIGQDCVAEAVGLRHLVRRKA